MTIVVTGGGSGGHITPLLAVAHELKKQQLDIKIVYIGQKGDGLADIPAADANIDEIHLIRAGKLRRYHGEGIKQLFDLPTVFKNIRDIGRTITGLVQSYRLLRRMRPDAVFIKGGFVCVPVGLAAAALRIPYVTHDSDALPGLANRIVAPWAKLHTVGLPKEVYSYPADKTVTVGVPLSHQYKPFSKADVKAAREQLNIPLRSKMVLITGGGLGAKRINDSVAACIREVLDRYKNVVIVHIAGRTLEASLRQRYKELLTEQEYRDQLVVKGFVTNLYLYAGAADVIITRAGATSIAEFAALKKACIVVPNPVLTGGHQLKNAKVLADRHAVKLVSEEKLRADDHALMPPLVELLDRPELATELGERLGKLTEPDSAKRLAMILLEVAA